MPLSKSSRRPIESKVGTTSTPSDVVNSTFVKSSDLCLEAMLITLKTY